MKKKQNTETQKQRNKKPKLTSTMNAQYVRIFLYHIYIHRMNAVMQLLRKNMVLIAAVVLVCLLSFVTVQYSSDIMNLLKGPKNQDVAGSEETAAAGAPVEDEVDAVAPPEDERPADGACGSAKTVTFAVPEDTSEKISGFDASDTFSNVANDVTKEANTSDGLISQLSQVLA